MREELTVTKLDDERSFFYWNLSLFFQLFGIATSTFLPLYWLSLRYAEAEVAKIDSSAFFISLLGPVLSAIVLFRLNYKSFVSIVFLVSGFFALLLSFLSEFFSLLGSFVIVLVGMGISSTLVPLSVVVMLSSGAFGASYASYRKFGSYGFLAGLLLSGVGADLFGARVYPVLVAIGFIGAGVSFSRISIDVKSSVFADRFSFSKIFRSSELLLFGFGQFLVWTSLGICFRYLPIRMIQMDSSSLIISMTVSLYGILALLTLRPLGRLSDRISSRYLWSLLPVSLFLRIFLLSLPENSYLWFFPIQVLHIPTWVLNDILIAKFLKDKKDDLGALSISVLTQFGMIFGMAGGSFLMSLAIPRWGLQESFVILSFLPLVFAPVFIFKIK